MAHSQCESYPTISPHTCPKTDFRSASEDIFDRKYDARRDSPVPVVEKLKT